MKQHKKSILIISHSYAPMLNPRAFRWTAIAEQFIQAGYKVDVITSWKPGFAKEEKIDNVHVFRVGESAFEKLRSKINAQDKKSTAQTSNISTNKKQFLKQILHRMHDFTWKKIYWPDYATLWKKPAIESAKYLLENYTYETVITVSDPFTSHLVGQEIKKLYPNVHWLVDIGDPFCFRQGTKPNNITLYKNKNYKVEKEIFLQADSISVTNENTKSKYAELFPDTRNKIHVIYPLLPIAKNSSIQDMQFSNENKMRLVFIGTLYKQIRNPKFLLNIFEKLMQTELKDKLELHFYGSLNDTSEEFNKFSRYLNESLFLHGLVSKEKVTDAMNQATVLINISNNNKYQLPSKLVEYMYTGNPIINIAHLSDDISEQFLNNYPSILPLNQNDSMLKQVGKCLSFLTQLPKKLSLEKREALVQSYNAESITNQYIEIFDTKMNYMSNNIPSSHNRLNDNLTKPILSVMTPVYNGEDFIERCYFMLHSQTFTDWEWVVVDDGSTDKTKEIIESIDDSRIKLITYKQNQGRGYARTEALKAAQGRWLVVWDVDDIYFPDRLEQNYKAYKENYDFCCSYVILIDNDIQVQGSRGFFPIENKGLKFFTHPTLGCKLEIAKKVGYDASFPAGEDVTLMVTLAQKYNGKWIKDALTMYQEVREVNIYKTISSNQGQYASSKILYKHNILNLTKLEYLKMIIKWNIKLAILQVFRLSPSLYLKTVSLRKDGDIDTEWQLSAERKKFIEQVQKRHNENNWNIIQTEEVNF